MIFGEYKESYPKRDRENLSVFFLIIVKKLRFTPCKPEQPLQGMELHEKEAQKD